MRDKLVKWIAFTFALLLSGCTTGQANTTPPVSGGSTGSVALQMAVGTVNFGNGEQGLNLLETFRDASGFTAIPITGATLRGPANFSGPKHSKDPGSGSAIVPLGSASNQFSIGTTVSRLAGADGWGIGPPSCSCPGINFYPFQPQFADAVVKSSFPGGPEPFYGGPPAYPPTVLAPSALSALVSIPSGWAQGFYFIGLPSWPPGGRYTIDVSYSQNGVTSKKSASAQLDAKRRLPTMVGHVFASSDNRGGLDVSAQFPRGVRQILVNVIDANVPPSPGATCATGLGFATLRFDRSGSQSVPDHLGNYGQGGARTFCKGDLLNIQVIGFDYDDFDLGPPGNVQQRPHLPRHADVDYTTFIELE